MATYRRRWWPHSAPVGKSELVDAIVSDADGDYTSCGQIELLEKKVDVLTRIVGALVGNLSDDEARKIAEMFAFVETDDA